MSTESPESWVFQGTPSIDTPNYLYLRRVRVCIHVRFRIRVCIRTCFRTRIRTRTRIRIRIRTRTLSGGPMNLRT